VAGAGAVAGAVLLLVLVVISFFLVFLVRFRKYLDFLKTAPRVT
jgi:hypothetical protein